jgi:hypothetical protein
MSLQHDCSHCRSRCSGAALSRRQWLTQTTGLVALAGATGRSAFANSTGEPDRQRPIDLPLKVQPILLFETYTRREATSWRPWGGIATEQDASQEQARIEEELKRLRATFNFPVETRPLQLARNTEQASRIAAGDHDTALVYAAGGPGGALKAVADAKPWTVMFLRHKSGPLYLWYEIMHPRFLRKTVDEYGQPGMDVDEVVVDEYRDVAVRLRALHALHNTLGKRIVAVGGASGWGEGGRKAPDIARNLWKMDLQAVSYDDLGQRIQRARADDRRVRRCTDQAATYLKDRRLKLETDRKFVENAFLLTDVFRDLLDEAKTDAITINNCMSTIMPIGQTTACLPLSLLNDDGYMAFCESDFVVIPSGVLMRYAGQMPVFLNDPTYPHHGVVTLAHCTAPRKMNGKDLEPARLLTHFESDYGAAPKVEMKLGQKVTNLVPDFDAKRWVGFEGEIVDNPFLPICRSQIDVKINGDAHKLLTEMRGFHWMTSYGSYVEEAGYALKKAGIEMVNVSKA